MGSLSPQQTKSTQAPYQSLSKETRFHSFLGHLDSCEKEVGCVEKDTEIGGVRSHERGLHLAGVPKK